MTDLARQESSTDLNALKKQVVVETFRSSGPGGQRKNKTETSVRLKHLLTGITVSATEHRLQSHNLKLAFERLRERLHRLSQKKRRRIPTNTPLKAVEKRIEEKKQKSFRKQLRGKIRKGNLLED
jgi:protein subunit release factor B